MTYLFNKIYLILIKLSYKISIFNIYNSNYVNLLYLDICNSDLLEVNKY